MYRLDLATQSWWWSDGLYALHGFLPGEVVPTTELVLAHQHPADRDETARFLTSAQPTAEPFGAMRRLVDARGQERSVVVVGRIDPVDQGPDVGPLLHGYATDVSASVSARASAVATKQIRQSSRSRGSIERAKGVLAAAYRITPDAAFEVMRTSSNHSNTPLREIARAVIEVATAPTPGRRDRLDALLDHDPGHADDTSRPPSVDSVAST